MRGSRGRRGGSGEEGRDFGGMLKAFVVFLPPSPFLSSGVAEGL